MDTYKCNCKQYLEYQHKLDKRLSVGHGSGVFVRRLDEAPPSHLGMSPSGRLDEAPPSRLGRYPSGRLDEAPPSASRELLVISQVTTTSCIERAAGHQSSHHHLLHRESCWSSVKSPPPPSASSELRVISQVTTTYSSIERDCTLSNGCRARSSSFGAVALACRSVRVQ
ncbi:hypothetical protein BJ508DRAFT_330982 [Ascobolus immersus RN42]|uniref:Uncharacterized protein n=1 Tax=Ascobolus immersus RN42 TaxID=1160509 RepID=A0A3N4HS10_ASCIM|nr:hypothetical protein BJ508DRAFT_330982 [Ascobolus immersus RN42]